MPWRDASFPIVGFRVVLALGRPLNGCPEGWSPIGGWACPRERMQTAPAPFASSFSLTTSFKPWHNTIYTLQLDCFYLLSGESWRTYCCPSCKLLFGCCAILFQLLLQVLCVVSCITQRTSRLVPFSHSQSASPQTLRHPLTISRSAAPLRTWFRTSPAGEQVDLGKIERLGCGKWRALQSCWRHQHLPQDQPQEFGHPLHPSTGIPTLTSHTPRASQAASRSAPPTEHPPLNSHLGIIPLINHRARWAHPSQQISA